MIPRKEKSPRRRAMEQLAVHCFMLPMGLLVRVLPLRILRRIAVGLAWLIGVLYRSRQRLMETNLQAVFGERLSARQRREIRKLSVINIVKTMFELVKMRWLSAEELQREANVEGEEHLRAALDRGRGVIIVTAHFGNWEYGGGLLGVLGYPMNVIARDANDPLTRDLINKARESKGIRVFGRWDARALLRALKNNECVAILPDQHAAEAAVRVRFLGRVADTATGPATFALRTGAAIVPAFAYREAGDHIRLVLRPALEPMLSGDHDADVLAITQRINDVLGQEILAHPEQWLWLHDRWKAERDV